ncbi:hypothetical protein T05_8808, partial [Trichinella murrelli]
LDHLSVFLIRCQESNRRNHDVLYLLKMKQERFSIFLTEYERVLGITRQIHGETQVITVYSLLKMNNTSRSSLQKHAPVVLSLTMLLKTVVKR